jgi:hypothetical protein
MKLFVITLCVLLAGCAGSSTQSIGPCDKYSAHDFWSSDTAMICHDSSGKVIGMVSGKSDSPASLISSSANAAVLGAAIPLAATLIPVSKASAIAAAAVPGK